MLYFSEVDCTWENGNVKKCQLFLLKKFITCRIQCPGPPQFRFCGVGIGHNLRSPRRDMQEKNRISCARDSISWPRDTISCARDTTFISCIQENKSYLVRTRYISCARDISRGHEILSRAHEIRLIFLFARNKSRIACA